MMPSSFLQYCQGAIAGAWQAECLGHWRLSNTQPHLWLAQWTLSPWQISPPSAIAWRLAEHCAQDLITHGQVIPDRWLGTEGIDDDHPLATLPTQAELLLALLPLALFYHDAPTHLGPASDRVFLTWQTGLQGKSEIAPDWPPDWPRIAVAWQVFARALALICRGHRDPMMLIPQVLTMLATTPQTALTADTPAKGDLPAQEETQVYTPAQAEMARCLQGVQQRLTQGAGLSAVLPWLIDQAGKGVDCQVVLALYCFLSAPRDFRCAVARSLQATQQEPHLAPYAPGIAALTGALAGSYQGGQGLPVASALFLNRSRLTHARSGTIAMPTVLEHMVPLVAAWAGAYQPYGRSHLPAVRAASSLGKST